ncbi:microtubule cross-linking factor 1 isoform X2 [Electrophorus electricus]|uniref:microtubule cross-linking factor 1 isoform X2 n=1 Tax=Electrophorus electricus TaxID=8005 RepID=UPI0015D0C8BF|nr:microtubule cross-linking factor 1 isoform X2 [Electrophorus electricus]
MESANGSGNDTKPQNHQLEKKRLNRAPSPVRPFLKDVHSRAPKPPAIVPKSPKFNKQQPSGVSLATQSRASRRTFTGAKEKTTPAKSNTKSHATKKAAKVTQHAATVPKTASKVAEATSHLTKSKRGKLTPLSRSPLSHGSPIRVPTAATLGRLGQTDSSSDLSDCASEALSDEQRLAQAASSDAESGTGSGSSDRDPAAADKPLHAASTSQASEGAVVRMRAAATATGGISGASSVRGQPGTGTPTEKRALEKLNAEGSKYLIEEDLLREIEELRSENDYLKDEMEELRAEMEEIRDSYLDEEVYQLQELRRELDRANKNCRILQYRLRKAEQRSLRTAQTGHVDGELLRTLEQDLKVAKDVSVRLHHELENVEDKRSRAEDENEMLRQKIIQVEISKQALHNELERAREMALRRRGGRETFKDKKSLTQEDSADLRCQLQFAKEESALMRKKMAKLGREKDEAEQELQKYRSTYGDVESPPALPEVPGGGPHSTREAELRLRLKLVEEEANILGRKIVELEVENRGLRAENEDLRCQYERDCFGREPFSSVPTSPYSADAPESAGELRRHLQFVEEEAELLRRSVSEMEDHNRQLTTELNRFKFGPGTGDGGESEGPEGAGVAGGRGSPASPAGPLQEELKAARVQIDELSGKVLKLQCENRVLISNMQRRDLAAHLGPRSASPRDSDADEEEAGRTLALHPKREGPVGGESDSEDVLEKTATSGFGSGGKSSDAGEPGGAEPAQRRREDREMLVAIRREAERLGKTVERLVVDTHSLICEGHLVATGAESVGLGSDFRGDGDPAEPKPDSQVLDVINGRMQVLRAELHTFMEKVDHLGDGLREHGDDLSPMPNLTESSSFLSTMTSMSRDSPIGTLGRDLVTDFQFRDVGLPDVGTPSREVQLCVDPERRQRVGQDSLPASVAQEEDRRRAEARQGLDLQGLQPSEPSWPQERAQLQQEVRLLRQNTVIVYMKLRWILMHWRLGRRADAADEGLATYEHLESIPEVGAEPGDGGEEHRDSGADQEDMECLQPIWGKVPDPGPFIPSPERFHYQKQVEDSRRVLRALRSLLEELRAELREEAQSRCQLQQTLANERAAWEIQRAEMRSRLAQLEELRGGASASGGGLDSAQREGQQQLLADSHAQALELRWKLQHSERRWSRERRELLEAFERERQEWERSLRSLRRRMEKTQREIPFCHSEGFVLSEGGVTHIFASPQDSPRQAPRSPRSPRTAPAPPTHSHSDPEAALEERGAAGRVRSGDGPRPPESLFLDALSLDPLSEAEVPAPSRLDSEKRFPCLNEALNEISERTDPAFYTEDEMSGGSLLRAKSVCSMSDFHRLMDSSPFLPDKSKPDERGRDEVTPPLSPDDFKYIEEFNNKGWDLSASPLAPIPPPAPPQPEARAERADARRADHSSDAFQPASWFLATSAALTAATLSSPERRQRLAVPEPYGVRVVHSPTRGECPAAGPPEQEYILSKVGKAVGEGEGEAVFSGKWPCDLREHLEGGPRPAERLGPPCATAGYAASLELSRNLSDDMKEVAFSVRNAIRSGAAGSPPERRRRRDAACQTDGFATRATQTAQTAVSVGLQTDALRALTGSPHRCLTPKGGGSTPISSPSRSLRKVQYSPTVQAKFERPCCSPKYGSPKLQRKPSSTPAPATPGRPEAPAGPARAPPLAVIAQPPKGNSESAWARSTTTRDSPVHSTINDGLSSLFNIIDHTPITYDPMQKFNRSPSRSRPACDSGSGSDSRGEAGRGCRGRSPSPGLPLAEGEKTPETTSIRQDLSAPPGHTLAENAARILNRKLLEQSLREEKRPPAAADADKSGCIEDLPRTAVAPPLESCFQRPSRPANRRPPSRWAAHSPSSSPSYKDRTERFRFPSPSPPAQMFPEKEEPS